MKDETTFKTNQRFKSINYDADALSWYFVFDGGTTANVSALWRLLVNKEIQQVSLDHGHQFGLPKPIDLVEQMTEHLKGKSLLEIKIKEHTGDLLLTLTDNYQIEVFISSSAYETYNFTFDNKNYIGMGGGETAIMNLK
jgi:hypothetical protein